MTSRTLELVRLFCVAVALVGVALLATLIATTRINFDGPRGAFEFIALAASVVVGELFPLELPRRSGDGEVTVSVMFSFALLLGVGLLPALAAQLAASMLQDRIARKPWWQVGFNIGQYTLSLTAAAAVLKLAGGYGALHANGFTPTDLLTVMGAAAAYFSVNLLLVTRATTLYQGIPFARALADRHHLRTVGRRGAAVPRAGSGDRAPVQPDSLPAPARAAGGRVHQRTADGAHRDRRAPRPPRQPHRAAKPPLVPGGRRTGTEEPSPRRRRPTAGRPQRLQGSERHTRSPPR